MEYIYIYICPGHCCCWKALQGIKGANWRKALEWLQRAPDAVVICNLHHGWVEDDAAGM